MNSNQPTTKKLKTAILCRTNAPLLTCAFDLVKKGKGIKVRIVGKDIAKKLKDIVGEILDYRRNCNQDDFQNLLDYWIEDINQKYGDNDKFEKFVAECNDYYSCLTSITFNCDDALGVYKLIDTFFIDSDEVANHDDSIILCSGHRSKGLEWDRVIILRPDLMPHSSSKSPADLQQEEHLRYIMPTRAKEELIICWDLEPK